MELSKYKPSESDWVHGWIMATKWMLDRFEADKIKRKVDKVQDARNYRVNPEGNIVEAEDTPVNRDLNAVSQNMQKQLEKEKAARETAEDKLKELRQEPALPGMDQARQEKIQLLEEILGEDSDE